VPPLRTQKLPQERCEAQIQADSAGFSPGTPPATRHCVIGHSTGQPNTSLARLCRYYLDCLGLDDRGGVSQFAASSSGDPNDVELQALPMYTKGLESELRSLQSLEEAQIRATALGTWLEGQVIESPPPDQQPLLEVLALNSEQRQAVRQALSSPLTVITGPPGTGKTQVVTSILVNAARQGKTALFASKNNKAVDLVETRVNALGPRPVLLRLGTHQYQSRVAECLVSLLAATADEDDHERYRRSEALHVQLRQRSDRLDAELHTMVTLRNEVDGLEQQVEQIRQEVGEEVFRRLQAADRRELTGTAGLFQTAVDQATRARQPFLTRLVWPFVRKPRFRRLADAGESFQKVLEQIGLSIPEVRPDSSMTVGDWCQYRHRLSDRVSQVMDALQYFGKLAALTGARSLEELGAQWKKLREDLTESSEELWRTWLRLQRSRMSSDQRKLLGEYGAVLQTIASAPHQHHRLRREAFRRYYQLFPQLTSILSCWAVTSLSARGRVPFAPNVFDVLVIDEASQCDIASAMPLLFRARRVAVIGDPMQLRHISRLSGQQDQRLLSRHDLVNDYAGWAYSSHSLFDLASSLCRSEDVVALLDHHRSHADIIEFSNKTFYGGRLRIATNYDRLRRPCLDEPAVRWVDVHGRTVRPAGGGAMNEAEARAVVREIERLLGDGYRGTIGVVSPFRAQANRIRDLVHGHERLVARLADVELLADTVHRFQGDERDVMIFSPVVSSGVGDGALGFLRSNPNLFNVAITRARASLVVVGDREAALGSSVDYLARFAAYAGQLRKPDEPAARAMADDLGPEYPAVSGPERVSEWERLFYRALYRAGVRASPRYPVERYLLDFALLDGKRRLAIEIDGDQYHRSWNGDLCRRYQIRADRLRQLGWDVMSFWVYQVRDDLDRSVARVQGWARQGRVPFVASQ
jgi:very-short-patch-repair endonuclease/RecA/RadA recombinase